MPLDGSALAEQALPVAATLARASNGRLVLVGAAAVPVLADHERHREQLGDAQEAALYLRHRAEQLSREVPTWEGTAVVETVVVPILYGTVAEALCQEASRQRADVVVMATHGRSGLGRLLYGSVADDVLRHAPVPVLLVPAARPHRWSPRARHRSLVPLDGSPLAEAVLPAVADLALALGTEVELLRVLEPPGAAAGWESGSSSFHPAAELVKATRYLEDAATPLRERGITIAVCTEVGQPAPAIARIARERDVAAIALATHGRGGLARVVLGSVATGVLQRTAVPLLLVRSAAPRPEGGAGQAASGDAPGPAPEAGSAAVGA